MSSSFNDVLQDQEIMEDASGKDEQMPNGVEVAYFIERKEDHADGIRNSASNQQKDGG